MYRSDRNWTSLAAFILLAAVIAAAFLGCGGEKTSIPPENIPADDMGSADAGGEDDAEGPEAAGYDGEMVHMCGRSVLGGWFEHWGWEYDPEDPVRFSSYRLIYHEMSSPPDIVDSAGDVAREAAAEGDGMMFFKLCFEDFVGGDEYSARENLAANEEIVRDVVGAAVEEEGLTLILGNALPMVREYTDDWLIWNHREYDHFLDELAQAYGGKVVILDLYGALAESGGWLRSAYAADPYDSHLNDAAYTALDAELEKLLGE